MDNFKPLKKWGQVFLKNINIKKKIAGLVNDSGFNSLVEIGPGLGAITEYIDMDQKDYWAVEIDSQLSYFLSDKFPKINVLNIDFLDLDILCTNLHNKDVLVFGNIPYNISTPIFLKFLGTAEFTQGFFMVQKEYFVMMNSSHKTKHYSSFSVLIQSFCKIKKQFDINRNSFFPKPKIDSTFFSLEKISKPLFNHLQEYSVFLRVCFSMPRKTLFNNLRKKLDTLTIHEMFQKNNLMASVRAEELMPQQFEEIFLNSIEYFK